MQSGRIFLEYFFNSAKVLALTEEISARIPPDFILKAQFLMTDGALAIGTQTNTRSASLTQRCIFEHNVTFGGGFRSTCRSYANTFISDFLEKCLKNHEPILPPAPMIDISWIISVIARSRPIR